MNSRQTTTSTLAFAALLSVTLSGCFNVLDRVEANNAGQVRFTTVVEMDTYLFSGDEPADPRTACAIAYEAYKETTPKDDVQYAANAIGMRLTDATAKAAWEVQCTWTSRWFAPLELDERARATLWADPVVQDTELFVSPRKPVDFDDLRKVFEDQMYEKADARRCLEPQPLDLPCDEEVDRPRAGRRRRRRKGTRRTQGSPVHDPGNGVGHQGPDVHVQRKRLPDRTRRGPNSERLHPQP